MFSNHHHNGNRILCDITDGVQKFSNIFGRNANNGETRRVPRSKKVRTITTLRFAILFFSWWGRGCIALVVGGNHKMRAASKPNWLGEDLSFYHSSSSNQPSLWETSIIAGPCIMYCVTPPLSELSARHDQDTARGWVWQVLLPVQAQAGQQGGAQPRPQHLLLRPLQPGPGARVRDGDLQHQLRQQLPQPHLPQVHTH